MFTKMLVVAPGTETEYEFVVLTKLPESKSVPVAVVVTVIHVSDAAPEDVPIVRVPST
jgi:hypothetical protein